MGWSKGPRPLRFIRVRIYADTVDTIRDILQREQDAAYDRLAELRDEGRAEDDEEIQEIRHRLSGIIRLLADIDQGLIELVGPH
jgi:hypothetical protein